MKRCCLYFKLLVVSICIFYMDLFRRELCSVVKHYKLFNVKVEIKTQNLAFGITISPREYFKYFNDTMKMMIDIFSSDSATPRLALLPIYFNKKKKLQVLNCATLLILYEPTSKFPYVIMLLIKYNCL